MSNSRAARHAGVTLVELIVAIVIVGVAVAGLVSAFRSTSSNSADPVIVRQMAAIAEAMMEEVLLKPFAEAPNPGAGRANFNDIFDYGGPGDPAFVMNGVTDAGGVAVPGLGRYTVTVSVARSALTGVPQNDAAVVTVTVSYAGFDNLVLRGWRTRAGP